MTSPNTTQYCLNCGRSEMEMPLVTLRHAGKQAWICSSCLPVLIHKPQQLAGKLQGAEQIEPANHDH
ncbi:MAG: hypothetical protein KC419_13920 [Anaerolineales bacterium]|nr:hypothetical protein [Anaerolineales bacterium]MCA9929577.1 hypothetical protein [Anaerolineales bacterium]